MGRGVAALSTNQRTESTSGGLGMAENGVSAVGSTVVLGQNLGDVGIPASLQSDREIPLNNFSIQFTGQNTNEVIYIETATISLVGDNNGTVPGVYINSIGGLGAALEVSQNSAFAFPTFVLLCGQAGLYAVQSGLGLCVSNTQNPVDDGGDSALFVTENMCVRGGLKSKKRIFDAPDLQVIPSDDSDCIWTNRNAAGAPITTELPPAAAVPGMVVTFLVEDIFGGQQLIAPQGADNIQIGTTAGVPLAPAISNTLGSSITLVSNGVSTWYAISIVVPSAWTV